MFQPFLFALFDADALLGLGGGIERERRTGKLHKYMFGGMGSRLKQDTTRKGHSMYV